MEKKKIMLIILAIIVLGGVLFITNKEEKGDYTQKQKEEEIITEEDSVSNSNQVEVGGYKDLAIKAHEEYKKANYKEALSYINQALAIEKNDRLLMSLYGIQLALKNFPEAEKAIKTSISLNSVIIPNWIEYAAFERYYMNASFEVVSGVYEKALVATNNNINIIVNYASYLGQIGKNSEAIVQWQKAIEVHPAKKDVYQAEIDQLN